MHSSIVVVDVAGLEVDDDADAFIDRLGAPTVVRIGGRDAGRVRVVSGSIHGNEPSGARALHGLLREGLVPATDLLLVFGALDAARLLPRFSHRMVPGRRDLNRCFRGPFDDDNGRIARAVLDVVQRRPIEAAVDIHNTTGKNPDFVIAGVVDGAHAGLASLFSDRYLAWRLQLGTFSEVLDDDAVALTFECGQVGDPAADARALDGARRFISADVLPDTGTPAHLYRDPVRVRLADGTRVAFGGNGDASTDVVFAGDLDRHNFARLEAGADLGRVRPGAPWPLRVDADDRKDGLDRSHDFFVIDGGVLRTKVPLVPLMITTNAGVAASDCLCYAVHPDGREGA